MLGAPEVRLPRARLAQGFSLLERGLCGRDGAEDPGCDDRRGAVNGLKFQPAHKDKRCHKVTNRSLEQ